MSTFAENSGVEAKTAHHGFDFNTFEKVEQNGLFTDASAAYRPGDYPATPNAASRPTPLPKRPKGRLLIGGFLLVFCGLVGNGVWNAFFRYRAYGLVVGHVAEITAPWEGIIKATQARESERINQDQILVTLDSFELRQELERLGDELLVAQANLDAEISRLKWLAQERVELTSRSAAQHHAAVGEFLEERSTLELMQRDLQRARGLQNSGAISIETLDRTSLAELGQRDKISQLERSVDLLRIRAEQVESLQDSGTDQLKPFFAKIKQLQSQIARVRDQLGSGQLIAPFDGHVIRRCKLVGERVSTREPLLEILPEGSLEVVLYLTQDDSNRLQLGDTVPLTLDPYPDQIPCQVIRIGQELCGAPDPIKRFYWSDENLLPVYLIPDPAYSHWMGLKLGSVIKLGF